MHKDVVVENLKTKLLVQVKKDYLESMLIILKPWSIILKHKMINY